MYEMLSAATLETEGILGSKIPSTDLKRLNLPHLCFDTGGKKEMLNVY
jgi:hypothetical protein